MELINTLKVFMHVDQGMDEPNLPKSRTPKKHDVRDNSMISVTR